MQITIQASTGINAEQVKEISKEGLIMKVVLYLNTTKEILVLLLKANLFFIINRYLNLDHGDLHANVRY